MSARSEPYDAPAIVTFAKELEAWRTKAKFSKKELADILGYTDSYVGQVELCKNIPSEDFAEALDTYFDTNGIFHRLRERIIESRHIAILPPGFPEYLEYEGRAISVRNFSPNLINGILQAEGYARTVLGSNRLPDRVDQLVHDRLKRAEILTCAHAYFTMDEMALRRIIGSPEIMYEQLAHILEISERPTISVDIVPVRVGFHDGLGGAFTILGFEDGSSIAYTELSGEGVLIKQPAHVARHAIRYDSLRGHALSVEESRRLIRQVMEGLRGC